MISYKNKKPATVAGLYKMKKIVQKAKYVVLFSK